MFRIPGAQIHTDFPLICKYSFRMFKIAVFKAKRVIQGSGLAPVGKSTLHFSTAASGIVNGEFTKDYQQEKTYLCKTILSRRHGSCSSP